MYTLVEESIKTRLDGSSRAVVTSLSILSLGMWKSCSLFFSSFLVKWCFINQRGNGESFFFPPRLVAVFYLFFNVGPCFADVLFEIKAYSLSLFLSFIPSSEGAAVIKDTNREPCLLVIRHYRRSHSPCKMPPLPVLSRSPTEEQFLNCYI